MFLLCLGMRRAASSTQYQIARDILFLKQKGDDLGFVQESEAVHRAFQRYGRQGRAILKTHLCCDFFKEADPARVRFVSTFRDMRDVVLSFMRGTGYTFERMMASGFLQRELESFAQLKALHPVLMQAYPDFTDNIPKIIRELAGFLDVGLTPEQEAGLCREHSLENQKRKIEAYSKTFKCRMIKAVNGVFLFLNPTQRARGGLLTNRDTKNDLHVNHFAKTTTDWRTQLSEKQKDALKPVLSSWLIDNGFEYDDAW